MSKGPHTPKQRDITRAIKGAQKAGLTGFEIAIDPKTGEIKILSARADLPSDEKREKAWDEVQ